MSLVKHNGKWVTIKEYNAAVDAERKARNAVREARNAPQASTPAPSPAPQQVEPPSNPAPATDSPDPAEVAEYCAANGRPDMAAKFIRDRVPMAEVHRLVDVSDRIRTQFEAARAVNPEIPQQFLDEMLRGIAGGTTSPEVAGKMFCEWLADHQSPEIMGQLSSSDIAGTAAGNHGWDRALAQAGKAKVAR
ncbi:hypothetical protein [Dongia sp.]|uniref:hypothetical protein n=1 Tax=Dongia sp. TaxID=1977262 RepID=UPI0035B473A0